MHPRHVIQYMCKTLSVMDDIKQPQFKHRQIVDPINLFATTEKGRIDRLLKRGFFGYML